MSLNCFYWDLLFILVFFYMIFYVYKLIDRVLKFKIRYYYI